MGCPHRLNDQHQAQARRFFYGRAEKAGAVQAAVGIQVNQIDLGEFMNETELLKNRKNPLGFEPIGKLMLKFAIPSIIAMVVNALYNIVDQIFIGRGVGFLGNGATNVIMPLTMIVLGFGLLIGDGCAAYLSLHLGRGEKDEAAQGVCNAITLAVIVGLTIGVLSYLFIEPLCLLFGATANILPYALDYGRIIIIGVPFMVINCALSGIIRADGSPQYSMMGMIMGCVVNIILNPLFIFGLHWGVAGSALATIIGQILNAVFYLLYIRKFQHISIRRSYFRLKTGIISKVCSLGISSFITQIAVFFNSAVSNNVLVKYGAMSAYGADIPMTTMGITMKINQLIMAIVLGIATGTQPILGFNYGAGNMERTKKALKIMVIASTVCMGMAFIAFQCFPNAILSIFGTESDLYTEFAVKCLRIFLLFCLLNGFQICSGIFFQAIGKPLQATVLSVSRQVAFLIPATLILPFYLGVEGALWAGPVADGLAFMLSAVILATQWKRIFNQEGAATAVKQRILENS